MQPSGSWPLTQTPSTASDGERPQTIVGGRDAYADLWSKAAALLQSIVNNHALIDGNKRVGWLATAVFLELNGIAIAGAANDKVYDLVVAVAATRLSVDEITEGLRQLTDSATSG